MVVCVVDGLDIAFVSKLAARLSLVTSFILKLWSSDSRSLADFPCVEVPAPFLKKQKEHILEMRNCYFQPAPLWSLLNSKLRRLSQFTIPGLCGNVYEALSNTSAWLLSWIALSYIAIFNYLGLWGIVGLSVWLVWYCWLGYYVSMVMYGWVGVRYSLQCRDCCGVVRQNEVLWQCRINSWSCQCHADKACHFLPV